MTNHANITITSTAKTHIRNQLKLTQAKYLRLGVKESGCNGYMYMLDFLEAPLPSDECFEFSDDVRVCVSPDVMDMVAGTVVDMITEGLNSALVFKNPNAVSYCGCGESFAIDGAEDSTATLKGEDVAVRAGDLATNVGPD